jgi:hypothetical protein
MEAIEQTNGATPEAPATPVAAGLVDRKMELACLEALTQVGLASERALLDGLLRNHWRGQGGQIDLSNLGRAIQGCPPPQCALLMALLVRYVAEVFEEQALVPDFLEAGTRIAIEQLDADTDTIYEFILAVEKRRTESTPPQPLPSVKPAVQTSWVAPEHGREVEWDRQRLRSEKARLLGIEPRKSKEPSFDFTPPVERPKSRFRWLVPAAICFVACAGFLVRSGSTQDARQLPTLAGVGIKLTELRRQGAVLTGRIADLKWRELPTEERRAVANRIYAISRLKGITEVKIVDGLGAEAITVVEQAGAPDVRVQKLVAKRPNS